MAIETISKLISKYTGSDADVIYGGTQNYIIGRNPEEESSYYFSAANSSSATAYMEWGFDLSSIPDDAEIDSVSCLAGGHCATTYHSSYVAQLYSGNTAKGNEGSLLESRHSTVTFDGGSWTRDELQDCRVRFTGTRKRSGTNKYCFVAGARITVAYTYQSEKFMLKLGGKYNDVARVFKKVSGIWVEQEELANVIEDGVRYQNGGEYVAPKKTVTIKGTGNSSNGYVTINGTKYTSAATVQVEGGTTVGITLDCDMYNLLCKVTLNGTVVHENSTTNAETYYHIVDSDCTITLASTGSGGGYKADILTT